MKCRRLLEYLDTSLSDFKQDLRPPTIEIVGWARHKKPKITAI